MKKNYRIKLILALILSLTLIFTFGCENEEANPDSEDTIAENESDDTPDTSDILGGSLTDFQTLDFDDNTITEEIFEEQEVNLIFVWMTG